MPLAPFDILVGVVATWAGRFRSDSFLYLYNSKEGLLSLPDAEADTVRFRECQGYLNRD